MNVTRQTVKSLRSNLFTKKTKKFNLFNNFDCTDDKLISEAFNEYFSEVTGNLKVQIPQTSFDPLSLIPIKS